LAVGGVVVSRGYRRAESQGGESLRIDSGIDEIGQDRVGSGLRQNLVRVFRAG